MSFNQRILKKLRVLQAASRVLLRDRPSLVGRGGTFTGFKSYLH